MPELPEVETIRRNLSGLCGAVITEVWSSPLAPWRHTTAGRVRALLVGGTVRTIGRRGKFLLFQLDQETALIVHLGMSGRLRRYTAGAVQAPHTHMILRFDGGAELHYVDARRFGGISLARAYGVTHPQLAGLGREFNDPQLTAKAYVEACRRHRGLTLKATLLHQGIVPGIGNIYACEALYWAALDPRRRVARTTSAQLTALLEGIRRVLQLGITHGGTTLRDYEDGQGNPGKMQAHLQVYGRAGHSTLDGRGTVARITQHGRSTWWCPTIQR